jgi:hypothetical protein
MKTEDAITMKANAVITMKVVGKSPAICVSFGLGEKKLFQLPNYVFVIF